MAKMNNDNLKKLKEKLQELAKLEIQRKTSAPATLATPVTISQLVAEGDRIIQEEAEEQVKKMSTAEEISSKNPYIKGRIDVLKKYPAWKRNEITEMEKNGNINNHSYDRFVKDVEEAGDKLSP